MSSCLPHGLPPSRFLKSFSGPTRVFINPRTMWHSGQSSRSAWFLLVDFRINLHHPIESHYLNSVLHLSSPKQPKHIESDYVHLNESPTDRPMSLAFFTLQKRTQKIASKHLKMTIWSHSKQVLDPRDPPAGRSPSSNYVAKWRGLNIEYWWILGADLLQMIGHMIRRSTVLDCIAW